MRNLLSIGRYLRWPLAVGTLAVVGITAWLLPSTLESLGASNMALSGLVFAVVAIGLTFWHRSNLDAYKPRSANWSYTIAHMGATAVAAGLIMLTFGFILNGVLWLGDSVIPTQAQKFMAAVIPALSIFPFLYYTGRLTADVLAGERSVGEIAETDPKSPHHPQNAFHSHSPSAYYRIKTDHYVSYFLTLVPCMVLLVPGFVAIQYMPPLRSAAVVNQERRVQEERVEAEKRVIVPNLKEVDPEDEPDLPKPK